MEKMAEAGRSTRATRATGGVRAAGEVESAGLTKLRALKELLEDVRDYRNVPAMETPGVPGGVRLSFEEFREVRAAEREALAAGKSKYLTMLKARDPETVLKNGRTLKEMAATYAKNVASNKRWTWVDSMPEGGMTTDVERVAIKELAIREGLIPDVPVKKVIVDGKKYVYADFESAGLVKREVQLPEHLWQASDAEQFKWLDEHIGGRPEGTTWHHYEKDGKMQLVDFGIHNVTNHNGGRTSGHWAYRSEGR